MYLYHFNLNCLPFSLTPNTDFYVDLPSHQQGSEVLITALKMGEGFIKVTGEVGTGKTLLCRKLLNELNNNFVSAYLPDPYMNPTELKYALASELGIEGVDNIPQIQLMTKIQHYLLHLSQQGKTAVLIVDEAQALAFETLEAIRLLTNLETEERKLLQVVLFGQPELDKKLAEYRLRQLRQRIAFSYQLQPLSEVEITNYIQVRCHIAMEQPQNLFHHRAIKIISQASQGIPRLINILCHKGLMLAYGEGKTQVSVGHIRQAILDTDDIQKVPYNLWSLLGWSSASLVIISGILVILNFWFAGKLI